MSLADRIKNLKDAIDPGSINYRPFSNGQVLVNQRDLAELLLDWEHMNNKLRAQHNANIPAPAPAQVPWGGQAPSQPGPGMPVADPFALTQPKKVVEPVPTRLSCEKNDPAYGRHDTYKYDVLINGQIEKDVVTADSAAGYYRAYVRDGKGDLLICGGEPEIRDYFATVEIRRKYDQF